MRRNKIWVLLSLFFLGAQIIGGADEFWIGFAGPPSDRPSPPSGPKYLMKIDSLGNIVIPATLVIPNSKITSSWGLAMLHGPKGKLIFWLADRFDGRLVRAVVDKKSLKLLSFHRTPVHIMNYHIQVTDKNHDNFLAAAVSAPGPGVLNLMGIRLTNEAMLTGKNQTLCLGCGSQQVGVTAKGGVLFFESPTGDLVLQRLSSNGHTLGQPATLVKHHAPQDVTDLLLNGRRYVLYLAPNPNHLPFYNLLLQPIDGTTFAKIGPHIKLGLAADGRQTIAVEPMGRFVIYQGDKGFVYQSLDATGHPSGQPKRLVANATPTGGVNILKDR